MSGVVSLLKKKYWGGRQRIRVRSGGGLLIKRLRTTVLDAEEKCVTTIPGLPYTLHQMNTLLYNTIHMISVHHSSFFLVVFTFTKCSYVKKRCLSWGQHFLCPSRVKYFYSERLRSLPLVD